MTSDPNRTGVQARFRARFRISFRIAGIGAAVLLVIAALVAGACGNPGGGSSEDEVSDDLVTGGTTIDDVESFAALNHGAGLRLVDSGDRDPARVGVGGGIAAPDRAT